MCLIYILLSTTVSHFLDLTDAFFFFTRSPFFLEHNFLSLIDPIVQLVSALDLVTSSVQVEGSILTAGKRLSLKNLNIIIRAIN